MPMSASPEIPAPGRAPDSWLRTKLRNYPADTDPRAVAALLREARGEDAVRRPLFDNPFTLDDLAALDDEALRHALTTDGSLLPPEDLAAALAAASPAVAQRVTSAIPGHARWQVASALRHPHLPERAEPARRRLLDALFWELTYWKTPDLYEALTEGEQLHPGLFPRLAPLLRGNLVLDAGAGYGRATLECLHQGARRIYAVEPSPGLLRLLESKLLALPHAERITLLRGRFEALPLADDSVDTALSCSAFTAQPEQGGEAGLSELRRVTRPGGTIVIIWPQPRDYGWLAAHGFDYVALPVTKDMRVRFRSAEVALRVVRRFYARNAAALRYLSRSHGAEIPFALLGNNPPHDYCWQRTAGERG
jgi:ubiquinone/menaquinone biosynthesis C-methylase UbiE